MPPAGRTHSSTWLAAATRQQQWRAAPVQTEVTHGDRKDKEQRTARGDPEHPLKRSVVESGTLWDVAADVANACARTCAHANAHTHANVDLIR